MRKFHQGAPIEIERMSMHQDSHIDDENAKKFFGKSLSELTRDERQFMREIREQNRE